jgi:hypothetical protein
MFSLLACLVLDQSSLKDFSKSCDNYPDTGGTRAYTELGIGLIALATTSGTLVCCALPVLLVTLGMGVVVSGLVGNFPFLVMLTHYKLELFAVSAGLMGLSGWLMYRQGRTCPNDPVLGVLCERLQTRSRLLYWLSIALWAVGFFASYLLLPI